MSVFRLRFKFIIFFTAFLLYEESFLYWKPINASQLESNINSYHKNKSNPNKNTFISINSDQFDLELSEKLKKLDNIFFDFLVNNKIEDEDNYSVDIESKTQYEKENIFYAESEVIINFSSAQLKGDKASYDRNNKIFVIENNVTFKKGAQYFEASKLVFDFSRGEGYIEDVYGALDLNQVNLDLNLLPEENNSDYSDIKKKVSDLEYASAATFGLVNDFEEDKRFNISDVKFEIPEVTKWRFKSNKINITSDSIKSDNIFFTNDVFNEPQFLLRSKKFTAEIVKQKLKIVSRKSSIILDDKLTFPIGKRTISDRDPISKWSLGSDYEEKDGFYISRGFDSIKMFEDYFLRLRPSFLLQRSLKGNTNSFTAKDSSILSDKVKNNISFLDNFALDTEITKDFNSWYFEIKSSLNSFNTDRFDEANRTKISLTKIIDLNKKDINNTPLNESNINYSFTNKIDLQFYGAYRERVAKGFSGDEEIYFAQGARIANRKFWDFDNKKTNLLFIYDLGNFKAEKKDINEFDNLSRNVLAIKYDYKFPIWRKNLIEEKINKEYKYSPKVINQGISWITNIDAGYFLYGNGSTQEAISFSSGPEFILGSFTNNYFDYTNFKIHGSFTAKGGESPFRFDNIDDTARIQLNVKQQLYGPLVFGYSTFLNLDSGNNDYGKISKARYSLDFRRRAYTLEAFYDSSSEAVGVKFNIFNFNYSGLSPKF